jgi:hypothetical protein
MAWKYSKHYTREEARALLPQIRVWLEQLAAVRQQLQASEEQMRELLVKGHDLGGSMVNHWIRRLADVKDLIDQFQCREIEVKDIDRGLVDFPAFLGGREVFLCWEKEEEDIEFWHDLDAGYAGRERIP